MRLLVAYLLPSVGTDGRAGESKDRGEREKANNCCGRADFRHPTAVERFLQVAWIDSGQRSLNCLYPGRFSH